MFNRFALQDSSTPCSLTANLTADVADGLFLWPQVFHETGSCNSL